MARGIELDHGDKAELRKLLSYTKGDYLPSKEEYQEQINRIERLDRISYQRDPELFKKIANECSEFEGNKHNK